MQCAKCEHDEKAEAFGVDAMGRWKEGFKCPKCDSTTVECQPEWVVWAPYIRDLNELLADFMIGGGTERVIRIWNDARGWYAHVEPAEEWQGNSVSNELKELRKVLVTIYAHYHSWPHAIDDWDAIAETPSETRNRTERGLAAARARAAAKAKE